MTEQDGIPGAPVLAASPRIAKPGDFTLELDINTLGHLYTLAMNYGNARGGVPFLGDVPMGERQSRERQIGAAWDWLKQQGFIYRKDGNFLLQRPDQQDMDAWTTGPRPISVRARNGIAWLLFAGLHPDSPTRFSTVICIEYLWPLAKKISRRDLLIKELKLDAIKNVELDDDRAGGELDVETEKPSSKNPSKEI